ncbi:MAG: gliding motility-associated C-terminal domain-containing protein [Bacteroidetes bacterium]|nr:MAG: gliding motility-associated C-terminal domain-containing protein [Bacteroidota bacterium]
MNLKAHISLFFIFFISYAFAQEYDGFGFPIQKQSKNVSQSNYRISQNTSTLPGYPLHFNTVRALDEINVSNRADAHPWLSDDALRLYYSKGITNSLTNTAIYYTSRLSIESNFGIPIPIIEPNTLTSTAIMCPFLTDNELTLFYIDFNCRSGNLFGCLFSSKRNNSSQNFSNPQLVSILGLNGRILGASFTTNLENLIICIFNNQTSNTAICSKITDNVYTLSGFAYKSKSLDPLLGQVSKDGLNYYFSVNDPDSLYNKSDSFLTVSKRNNLSENFTEIYYIDDTLLNKKDVFSYQPSVTSNESVMVFARSTNNSWLGNDLYIAYNSTANGQYLASVSVVGLSVVSIGGIATYSAVVLPLQNSSNAGINWSVGPPELASISGTTGQLVALSAGVATVTATAFSCCTTLSSTLVLTILGSLSPTCIGSNCNTFVGTCLGNNCNTTVGIGCKSTLTGAAFSHSFSKDTLLLTMQTNPNLLKGYEWVVGDIIFKNKNPVQYLTSPTDSLVAVQLRIIDNANCTDTTRQSIRVWASKPIANNTIANVFTPNGDGYNDEWQPLTEKVTNYHLQVYNRYGVLVFESTTWNQAWSGATASDGLYFYYISYQDSSKTQKKSKGWVEVVR